VALGPNPSLGLRIRARQSVSPLAGDGPVVAALGSEYAVEGARRPVTYVTQHSEVRFLFPP